VAANDSGWTCNFKHGAKFFLQPAVKPLAAFAATYENQPHEHDRHDPQYPVQNPVCRGVFAGGCTVGRVCNRIALGKFTLEGKYLLGTGTTHLHNLMSADATLRSLPYWESLEPVLPESEQPAPGEPDPRIARTAVALDFVNTTMPYFKRMHEMTVDHVHEEIQLLAIDFSTMLFETTSAMPSWRDYYLTHDQTPHYEYMRTVLKVLQWLRGGEAPHSSARSPCGSSPPRRPSGDSWISSFCVSRYRDVSVISRNFVALAERLQPPCSS